MKLTKRQPWNTGLFFVQWSEYKKHAEDLIKLTYQLKSKENEKIASGVSKHAKSDEGLFESKFNFLNQEHKSVIQLKGFIEEAVKNTVFEIHNEQLPFESIEINIVDSWFHITNNGGYHDAHYHPNCSWCGIFYLQPGDMIHPTKVADNNGINRFYTPISTGGGYQDYGNQYLNGTYYDIEPKIAQLVIFPSYLLHSALPYTGKLDRIAIAFNAIVSKKP